MTNEKEDKEKAVNEGTRAKQTLQGQSLRHMASYSTGQSLTAYAELLCWDLCVTKRTAFDSYILPMLRHGYLKYVGNSAYDGKALYNFINSQEQPNTETHSTQEQPNTETPKTVKESEKKFDIEKTENGRIGRYKEKPKK